MLGDRDLICVNKLYQYFYLYICGNNVLIDWLIIKVRDLHVSCSADGVQAGCDQEIDKANGNKNVVDLCMRVKKIVLNLFV